MTFDQTRHIGAAGWVLAVGAVALTAGVDGTAPVLWASASALIPAGLWILSARPPARTVARSRRSADGTP